MFSSVAVGIVVTINLLCTCNAPSPRIVGGRKARLGEFPMLAQIAKHPSGDHHCGGTVLTQSIVMSAAHCFVRCGNVVQCVSQFRILVGDVNRHLGKNPPASRQVRLLKTLIPHEQFTLSRMQNDIILIELNETVWFSKNAAAGILAKTTPPIDEACIVAGWGREKYEIKEYPLDMLVTSVSIVDTGICQNTFKRFKKEYMICAGDLTGENDSCIGDSGGPLICHEDVVVGIVSFGYRCAEPGYSGVYTDVSVYRHWIFDKISETNARNGCICTPPKLTVFKVILFMFSLQLRNFKASRGYGKF